jgi:RNA polymerase sigma factor (sigma-70 family)
MRNGERGEVSCPANLIPDPIWDGEPSDRELLERFAADNDAPAFAALIRRHGPMVLGVCRRVLNQQQDAEDAFQITFLVLVRKAASLTRPELLGNWLYGVAYRTAQKARARIARQRHHERRVDPMSSAQDPYADVHWQELRTVLDQELKQLPPKYRAPLVLCYLEGMTNEQAARRLGWPVGSMSYRLARARQMLRDRLRARRQMFTPVVLGALLSRHAAPGEVPAHLEELTLHMALASGGGRPKVPPIAPPLDPRGQDSSGNTRAPRWRRYSLALLALVTVAAAGATAYPAMIHWIGHSGGPAPNVAPPGDPSATPACHH